MPGSKTYTSSKVNELVELEIFDGLQDLEKQRLKGISFTIFLEVIKISLSILITSLLQLPSATDEKELILDLKTSAICICVFVVVYLVLNLLVIVGKWLFDACWNKRRLLREKKLGHAYFHKKIVNHIYIAISFENKYIAYLKRSSSVKDNLNVDLGVNYLSQATHYFKIAKSELVQLIPPEAKRRGKREIKNAQYLAFIGYPVLNSSLVSAQRSLHRLLMSNEEIMQLINNIDEDENVATIKKGYGDSVEKIYFALKQYADDFEEFLERVLTLEKLI
ncbi:MAG: hypothetical protein IJX95_04525 [Lachnospiraceae bacterium]|nr:hypothetical protein [Lachnospiraceae bacterium]